MPIRVDLTDPVSTVVWEAFSLDDPDPVYTYRTSSVEASWPNWWDSESPIVAYQWRTRGDDSSEPVPWTLVALMEHSAAYNLEMHDGVKYFVDVIAVNKAGRRTALSSNGFVWPRIVLAVLHTGLPAISLCLPQVHRGWLVAVGSERGLAVD